MTRNAADLPIAAGGRTTRRPQERRAFRSGAGIRALDRVFLHQDPTAAAFLQRPDELIGHIRLVR